MYHFLRTRYYFDFRVDINDIGVTTLLLNVANINLAFPGSYPSLPSVITLGDNRNQRAQPYGALAGYASSDDAITSNDMRNKVLSSIKMLPSSFNASLKAFNFHVFQPYFSLDSLKTKKPYKALASLQGKHSTFWLSALNGYADSAVLWQKSKTLVDLHFPSKKPLNPSKKPTHHDQNNNIRKRD